MSFFVEKERLRQSYLKILNLGGMNPDIKGVKLHVNLKPQCNRNRLEE